MTDNSNRFKTWGGYWDLLANRLVNLIGITDGARVIDIGTGGGSTLHASLMRVGPSGYVAGVENVEDSVTQVNSELARCNVANSEVFHTNATELPFPDNSFDFAISGFLGWRRYFDFTQNEFTGPNLVMSEALRVLKPEGTIGISTWLFQEDTEWMERFVESYSHPPKRTYSKESEEGWKIILENSSLKNTCILKESVKFEYADCEHWWNEMMNYGWKSQIEFLSEQIEIDFDSIKKEAFDRVMDYHSTNCLEFNRRVLYALGKKP